MKCDNCKMNKPRKDFSDNVLSGRVGFPQHCKACELALAKEVGELFLDIRRPVNYLNIMINDGSPFGLLLAKMDISSTEMTLEELITFGQRIVKATNEYKELVEACQRMAQEWDERGVHKYGDVGAPEAMFAIKHVLERVKQK